MGKHKKTKTEIVDYQQRVNDQINLVLLPNDDVFNEKYALLGDEQKAALLEAAVKNYKRLDATMATEGEINKTVRTQMRAYVIQGNQSVLTSSWTPAESAFTAKLREDNREHDAPNNSTRAFVTSVVKGKIAMPAASKRLKEGKGSGSERA